jgi:hypothetical protein
LHPRRSRHDAKHDARRGRLRHCCVPLSRFRRARCQTPAMLGSISSADVAGASLRSGRGSCGRSSGCLSPCQGAVVDGSALSRMDHLCNASTIASNPARTALGSDGQASTNRARSVSNLPTCLASDCKERGTNTGTLPLRSLRKSLLLKALAQTRLPPPKPKVSGSNPLGDTQKSRVRPGLVLALVLSANGTRTRNDRGARTNVRSAIHDVFACFAMRFLKIRIAVAKEI